MPSSHLALISEALPTHRPHKADSREVRDKMLLKHLPLVRKVAGRLISSLPRSVRMDDLVSAGTIGLINSVENFDPELGTKFETFAVNRIRGAMVDSLRELDWVPRSVRQKARQLDRMVEQLTRKLGRAPHPREIAETMSLDLEQYRQLLRDASAISLIPLDEFPSADRRETSTQLDLVDGLVTMSCHEIIEEKEQRAMIVRCLKELPGQEKLVLALYYYEELTFREIGDVLRLTESRVSQIHTKAITTLRTQVSDRLTR